MTSRASAAASAFPLLFTTLCFAYGAFQYAKQGSWVTAALFALCAILFLGWSIAWVMEGLRAPTTQDKTRLRDHGQKLVATFTAIDRRWSTQVNGQSPIVVFAQATDPATGTLRTFESDDLWFSGSDAARKNDPVFNAWRTLEHPDPALTYTIPVYLDPTNPERYAMDLAGLDSRKKPKTP